MTTIHFVYPCGSSISTPQAIGRNVAERLRHSYRVLQYDWDETGVIEPAHDDVLLGHPHPAPWTIFRRSARRRGWKRVIALSPYSHDPKHMAFFDSTASHCDLYLAITGNFWFESIRESPFSHWAPKMIHVDLAVDRHDFPVVNTRFNLPGFRRFLYIGHTSRYKNTEYLTKLAKLATGCPISWMGTGSREIRGATGLGSQDFASDRARRLVANHDFLLTVGRADPNPSTILEAMAWGLVPVCTMTSGYVGYPGIVNLPLDDPINAVKMLENLQVLPEPELLAMQRINWQALDAHFNWDRFAGQVLDAIRSDRSPPTLGEGLGRKVWLRTSALTSPLSPLRLRNLRLLVHRPRRNGVARAG